MPLSPAANKIVELGQRLYGDQWQSPFARMTGLSQAYISKIAAGDRPVTDAVHDAVTAGLKAESKRLRAQADELRAMWNDYVTRNLA
jgi:predicted transcriptional regulator